MGVGILARLVDVEAVVCVLERRYLQSPGDDAGNDLCEERGLAGAAPAGEADDAHAALYSSPRRAPRSVWQSTRTRKRRRSAGRLDWAFCRRLLGGLHSSF